MIRTTIPRDARSETALIALDQTVVNQKDWRLLLDVDAVHITEQAWGENPTQSVAVPRKVFDAFVEWYTTGKVPRGDKAARTPPREVSR